MWDVIFSSLKAIKKPVFSFQFKTNLRAMLYHPSGVLFFKEDNLLWQAFTFITQKFYCTCGCPSFGFFSQLWLSLLFWSSSREALHYCSTDILVLQISATKSLATLWLLVSIQRSADCSIKLVLGRKKYLENF